MYKVLPSEALSRASTFDLYVLDLHHKWRNHQEEQSNSGKTSTNLTQEQMKAMIERAKSFKAKERK